METRAQHKHYRPENERKIVKSAQMANYLLQKGHRVVEISHNKLERGRLMFVFENNNNLHYDMDEYKAFRHGNNYDDKR